MYFFLNIINTLPVLHLIKEIYISFKKALPAITAWILGYPFSLIIKRDSHLTVVIGRPGRIFADNSKYFFIYATALARKTGRTVFFTTDRSIRDLIIASGGESVLYPSFRSFYLLLKCKRLIFDWLVVSYMYPLIHGAKLIQIWHGAPLKHIELDLRIKSLARMQPWLRPLSHFQKKLTGRYPVYDVVVATSQEFIEKAFFHCFSAKNFIATGYPRNDILFGWPETDDIAFRLTMINIDKKAFESINSAKSRGDKICLYMPTFRKEMDNPLTTQIDLLRLSKFAVKNNLLFVLKLHPVMQGLYEPSSYPGLIEYAPLGDIYPIMPLCDLLITDYSSIYFDFLLLDRPILFFAYDLDNYLAQDRAMYFDYNAVTPGAKCRTYDELESKIENIIANGCDDEYAEMRKQVRAFTHDFMDNLASRRLLEYI